MVRDAGGVCSDRVAGNAPRRWRVRSEKRNYEQVRRQFPQIQVPAATPGDFPALTPYKFVSKDGNKTIQLSINRFSFHDKKYAGGFAAFKRECAVFVKSFLKTFEIKELKRTGLRYVNHIPINRVAGVVPIHKYLNVEFRLPGSTGKDFESIGTVLVSRAGDGKLRTLIETRTGGPQKADILLLDFDYFIEDSRKSQDAIRCLDISHGHTKRIFLDLISTDYLNVMRGN